MPNMKFFSSSSTSSPAAPTISVMDNSHSLHGDVTDVEDRGYITNSGEDTATDIDEKHPNSTTLHPGPDAPIMTKLEAATEVMKEDTAAHEGEDDVPLPSTFALTMISIALCLSVFCLALDNTIIG